MLVIVVDNAQEDGEKGLGLENILEEVKNLPQSMKAMIENDVEEAKVITASALKNLAEESPSEVTHENEELAEKAKDLQIALDMYTKSLDAGHEKDRYKILYNDNEVKMKKMESFRDSIYRELEKHEDLELPIQFIRGMNKKAVGFINCKKQQRFEDGVRVYEDLLAWIKESSEESRVMRGKIWFNLATAYQKGPQLDREKRKEALISGFNESPKGSAIKDRVLSVLNRDFAGMMGQ